MNGGVLILCIGNELVADDGVGCAVYERLRELPLPDRVRVAFLGLGGIDLLEEIDGEELLVVVDGVQLGGPAGTIHQLGWDQLPAMQPRPVSGHGIGIREAIVVGKNLYPERVPKTIYLIGIEGSCFNQLGVGLSSEVARAVPEAVTVILSLLGLERGEETMSENRNVFTEIEAFLAGWQGNGRAMRRVFQHLLGELSAMAGVRLQFVGRPGVSYSLRPRHVNQIGRELFAMIDVIDDDPHARWLSVCFYEDMITDPDGRGECIPGGLAGADGYCFDLNEYDQGMVDYLVSRLQEAAVTAAR